MEFEINTSAREPIYRQLASQIREGIARGQLAAGNRLPSVRELSKTLVVNPNTIARAYTDLEHEGVLHTRPGLGVFVAAPGSDLTKPVRKKRLVERIDSLLTEAVHLDFTQSETLTLFQDRMSQFQWKM
ncbi:MAG: GntR family transcriptional regulator [Planctomycetota bacterium]|jgi:GntR family transcriptional regulator